MKKACKFSIFITSILLTGFILYVYFFNKNIIVKNDYIYTGRLPINSKSNKIHFDAEFILYNFGISPINIDSATASCACTNVFYPAKIPAFSSVKIVANIEISPHQLSDETVEILILNDSKTPIFPLRICLETENYYAISDKNINFRKIFRDHLQNRSFYINISSPVDEIPDVKILNIPENFESSIVTQNSEIIEHKDGSKSKLTDFLVDLQMADTLANGKHEKELKVNIFNGINNYQDSIILSWEVLPFAKFNLPKYIFSKSQNEVIAFLEFDKSKHTISKELILGNNIEIIKSEDGDYSRRYTLKYLGNSNENTKNTLSVFFNNGLKAEVELYISESEN